MNFAGLKYLSRCSGLVSLKLGLCTNISDKGLSYVASNCLKIQELDLYRYYKDFSTNIQGNFTWCDTFIFVTDVQV